MYRLLSLLFLFFFSDVMHARLPDLIPYRKGDLWGYCDSMKKIIIQPQWEFTSPFVGNTAVVKQNGKYGLIDKSGRATTEMKYSYLEEDSRNGKRIAATKKRRTGLIDEHGREIIPLEYSEIYWESDKYLRVQDIGSYGEMDTSGKIIVPFDYTITDRDQGFVFGESAQWGVFVFSKGSGYRFGVVDSTGAVIIPFRYDMLHGIGGGYFSAKKIYRRGGVYHDSDFVFDRHGKIASWSDVPRSIWFPIVYLPAYVRDSSGLYYKGWMDTTYKMICERKLLYAEFHRGALSPFMTFDSLCGYVNEKFEVVIPAKYGWCSSFGDQSIALVYKTHHVYPKKRPRSTWSDERFDVARRIPLGYIDIHGTEYWE